MPTPILVMSCVTLFLLGALAGAVCWDYVQEWRCRRRQRTRLGEVETILCALETVEVELLGPSRSVETGEGLVIHRLDGTETAQPTVIGTCDFPPDDITRH